MSRNYRTITIAAPSNSPDQDPFNPVLAELRNLRLWITRHHNNEVAAIIVLPPRRAPSLTFRALARSLYHFFLLARYRRQHVRVLDGVEGIQIDYITWIPRPSYTRFHPGNYDIVGEHYAVPYYGFGVRTVIMHYGFL